MGWGGKRRLMCYKLICTTPARGPVCDSVVLPVPVLGHSSTDGMATINLFGDHPSFEKNMRHLRQAFDGRRGLATGNP